MTTPNSTTEAGGLADDEIGAAWDAAKARMSHDPYTPKEAFWAGALFVQSRQASAQGGERVDMGPMALRESVFSLVQAARAVAQSSAPSGIRVHGAPTRLLLESAHIDLSVQADKAEMEVREFIAAYYATPPATSGMPNIPDARTFAAAQSPGWATTRDWDKGWDACRAQFLATPPNAPQDSLVGDAERDVSNALRSNHPLAPGKCSHGLGMNQHCSACLASSASRGK